MTDTGPTRVLARCTDCGRTLAANRWPSGSVTFIGQPDGCPCGGTESRIVAGGTSESDPPTAPDGDEQVCVGGRRA